MATKHRKKLQRCSGQQTIEGVTYACFQTGKIRHDGKWYCPVHAPKKS